MMTVESGRARLGAPPDAEALVLDRPPKACTLVFVTSSGYMKEVEIKLPAHAEHASTRGTAAILALN